MLFILVNEDDENLLKFWGFFPEENEKGSSGSLSPPSYWFQYGLSMVSNSFVPLVLGSYYNCKLKLNEIFCSTIVQNIFRIGQLTFRRGNANFK